MSDKLFTPLKVGNITLAHRLVMAPLTRMRASDCPSHVPLPMVTTHYHQRSIVPGTLLISEGTHPTPAGAGYKNTPGIWSRAQIDAWRQVSDAVHANGSYIFMQLWDLGRVCNPNVLAHHGEILRGPSAIAISEKHAVPQEMSEDEIWRAIRGFADAARNAIVAGLDGVEIHAANGYLVHEFLDPSANQRTDGWGGSVQKRARFAVEVTKAVVQAVGDAKKVGIRFSPWGEIQACGMDKPEEQYLCVINELKHLGLAYLHLVEPRVVGSSEIKASLGDNTPFIKAWGKAPVFLAGGLVPESARKLVNEDRPEDDVVAVLGRPWTSNPDLVYRAKHNIPLVKYDRSTFYSQREERGYVDWPFSAEFEREHGSRL